MDEVGLREIRQNASELVRRAEAGERLLITVSGRPAAVLGPVGPAPWRRWEDVADIFARPDGDTWDEDAWADQTGRLDESVADPWARQ